ncbi:hypothetical protein KJW28_23095, partial [Pseudomonas syringae pv. aptata]|uniref:hypothetical protein n=1 Tax=Pseudomonas syringae TaxID=317 RepID=UPI001BDC0AEF
ASRRTPFLLDAFSGESASSCRLMRNRAPASCDVWSAPYRANACVRAFFMAKNTVLRASAHLEQSLGLMTE